MAENGPELECLVCFTCMHTCGICLYVCAFLHFLEM